MAKQKRGTRSFHFDAPPILTAWASVAGKKESEGPRRRTLSIPMGIPILERRPGKRRNATCRRLRWRPCCRRQGRSKRMWTWSFRGPAEPVYQFQLFSAEHRASGSGVVWSLLHHGGVSAAGIHGVSGGFADRAVAMTSSHFASSERQYRYPLGYGGQRTPTAQWTVTGSGAALVCSKGDGPVVEAATVGTIVDLGITDANNMGAAMAPQCL